MEREASEETTDKGWATRPRASTAQELVELFSNDVWRFTTSQVVRREDAEDITMEVFAAAFSDFAKVRLAGDQRLWLLGIARKKVAGSHRQRYRRAEAPLSDELAVDDSQRELRQDVQAAVQTLPGPQAEALILKYVNGLTTDEVAQVMRKSVQATNSLLQRAREAMRNAMGSHFNEAAARSTQ